MPGSMSGEEKRSDGLLGERSNERRRAHLAPPVLYATALLLDSTGQAAAGERRSMVGQEVVGWLNERAFRTNRFAMDTEKKQAVFYSVSTMLTRNLHDVFG